jgi:hypothetical protein
MRRIFGAAAVLLTFALGVSDYATGRPLRYRYVLNWDGEKLEQVDRVAEHWGVDETLLELRNFVFEENKNGS